MAPPTSLSVEVVSLRTQAAEGKKGREPSCTVHLRQERWDVGRAHPYYASWKDYEEGAEETWAPRMLKWTHTSLIQGKWLLQRQVLHGSNQSLVTRSNVNVIAATVTGRARSTKVQVDSHPDMVGRVFYMPDDPGVRRAELPGGAA